METNPIKLGKLSWGLIVLFVGVVLLLDNLDVIHFHWWAITRFWPVLIILFGVNVLLPKSNEGQILSVIATLATLVFLAFQGFSPTGNNFWPRRSGSPIGKQPEQMEQQGQRSSLSRAYDPSISHATLNISGSAVEYNLKGTTSALIDVETYSNFSSFSLSSTLKDNKTVAVLYLSQKGHKRIKLKKGSGNHAQIRLNQTPFWDINIELGAGKVDFDLKPFKVDRLKLEGGASSLAIALGMPAGAESKITFEGGVSSLKIDIPKQAGCRIDVESALSSLDFPGFIKQEDGSYLTDNYGEAAKKFEIELDNGLSSIEISRYEDE